MFSKYLRVTVSGFVVALFSLCFGTNAKAADTTSSVAGLIVSPPLIEKEVTVGNSYDGKIKITNPNSSTDLNVEISVDDFKANGEEGEQTFVDPAENSTYSLGAWVKIDKSFTLAANETKEIPYSVNIPTNAEPGGHYGVIFFIPSVQKSGSLSGNGVMAIPKIGSLLLFKVPGDIKYDGNIQEFKINKKLFGDSKSVVDFVTRFQNLSSTHVKPQGNIVIKNTFGKEVANLVVNEKMGNVLPDSIRKFDNSWEKKYGFGYYKATITLAYGDSGVATSEVSFWIIPWKETAGAIVIIIILIWIISHLKWGGSKNNTSSNTNTQPPYQPPVTPNPPVSQMQNPIESIQSAANQQNVSPEQPVNQTPPQQNQYSVPTAPTAPTESYNNTPSAATPESYSQTPTQDQTPGNDQINQNL